VEKERIGVARSFRKELALFLAVLSMASASCATVGVRSTDSTGADESYVRESDKTRNQAPSNEEGSKGKVDVEEEPELEEGFQEGMDEIEKCLDITVGDEGRAYDKAFFGKTSSKRVLKMKQVAKRCVSI